MKVEVGLNGELELKEIYGDCILVTSEGNRLAIAMRDDTVEMSVVGSDVWYRADMQTGKIEEM
jgi:hypothetical protein